MSKLIKLIIKTDTDKATIIIRFIVGYIFVTEGIQKFIYSDSLGVGRFIKIGILYPEIMAPFVGWCEIIFGAFLLVGFFVRVAFIPLIIIMFTAITTTKIDLLLNEGIFYFSHEARNDLLMIFGLIFIFMKGAGANSFDRKINNANK
ncbi:MAG TPA: DoxX family protein [Oligoflexia bacterium]|nr:DoxX family protein [Oligoflexia bacterium]HMP48892.1 DoxX family protein [Oligoflexia bacterium]